MNTTPRKLVAVAAAILMASASAFAAVKNGASLKGNEYTKGGNNVKGGGVIAWNSFSSVDPTAFSHDLSSETLTVLKDGDYLVAVTVPIYTFNGQRNTQRADLLVNGTAAPTGVGESSYIRWTNNHSEASDHFAVLVALKADDKLTVKTTPTAATGTTGFISTCSLYAELVEGDRNVFSASATEIQSGTNLNVEPDIGDQGLVWTSARKGSGYTHSDGEAGITIKDDGNYMVYANVPLRGNIARGSVGLTINLDDDYIEGARGQQGYIRNANDHKDSSIHFSGMIRAEAGQVLTVTTEQLALAGTVNVQADRAASIFIEKLRNDGLFSDQFTGTTAGEDLNPANKTALALVGGGMNLDIIDNTTYSNEGDNEENIVIKKAGDYLLTFNVTLQSSGGRVNPRFTVDVNGVEVPGATSTSHYIRNANAHNESTGSFVALLSDLAVDDVVTVNTTREANTQAVTSPEGGKVALQAKAGYTAAAGDTSPPKLSSIIGLGMDGFEAKIENFGLSVDAATIKAVVNGAESTVTTSKIGSITTITYAFASFPVPFSSHSVSLTYSDSAGTSYAKDFSFTVDVDYKSLPASFASTSVDKSAAGFIANVTQISTIQTEAANNVHGNSIANAEKQLRGEYLNPNEVDDDDNPLPYLNEADPDAWDGWSISPVEVDGVINWNQDEGAAIGNFGEDQAIPQIPGWGDSADGIVVEILGYLELSKGLHTLGVFSDDGFKLSFGPNPKDQLGIIAGQYEGWGQDVIFNIVAEADGLYPVRLLWVEGGGGANVEFFSVDDKGTKILINDPDNADAIKAYRTGDTAPYISRVAPAAGELSRTIEFDFINGDLSVVKSSVKMKFNGEDATVSTSSTDDGVSVVYDHGDYLPAGTHTVELSYSESGGVDRVRNYSITVPKGRVDILMDKPKVTIEFDDLTGDAAAGAVGNPDAHYINGPELGVAALYPKGVGTAVRFDGSKNTDLRITDHADINVTNGPWEERTWEFWFKPEQLPEAGKFGILFQEGGVTRGINIYLHGTEDDAEPNLYMMAWNRGETLWGGALNQVGGDNITAVTARVTVGNVNHLVLVMDGDASGDLEGTLTGYLNGQQVGQVSGVHMLYNHADDTSFGNKWTNAVTHEGDSTGTGGMGFTGVIDDASFYSTALSAEQVQTHFQGGFGDWTTAEIEAWLTAGPDIPLLQSKSPTGAAAEGEETEISVSFRGIDFTDLSITVNDTAVDPTITSEDGFSTITANGAFSLGKNVITVSWNGESETWNYYQFSVTESLTGLASYSVETVGAVPGPWEFKDGVWVSEGSVAGCGGPYHDFLTSPDYTVSADGEVTLSFEHRHAFEGAMWDSGQLWISVNGDAYADVGTDAFSENGYTDVAIIGNGIAKGQNGFGNTSAGHADGSYITTIASLGSFAAEDAISVRFVALYDDCSTGAKPNWVIASVSSDQMAIESIAPIVSNGSFEADDVPEWPGYGAITAWTGGSGINDGGPFGDNGVIPDGAKLGFIQGTKALSQQLTGLEAGAEYVLAFYYNARNCCGGTIGFTVSVGGEELGSVSDVEPVGGENAYNSASYYFVAAGTEAELVFSATAAGDATLLLDAVSVSRAGEGPAETPAPAELPWSVGLNDDGWPAGDGGGPNTTFVQEKGANELPGNPASPEVAQQGDDDYYWAGLYSTVIAGNGDYTPVGLVEANEESAERAFAGIDNDLRYHFNLPESLEPTDRLTVSYDALNLHTGEADSRYGIEVYVNNVQVQSEIVIREAELGQTYATDPFTLADVNAEVGSGYDNILTLKGVNYNAEGGGNWMGIDYVQLSQAGPATPSTILVDFGGTGANSAGASPDPWITIDNLVMDQAASLGGGVTITALDDGFNPNNTASPGAGAEHDGVSVPQEARNDYLFKIADAAGTTARMRIDGLAAGTYNVTVFEGRTTDASQFAKIWTGEEPAAENTGDFAKGSATVTVTVGAGESLWYMHLEDGSGGVSGMMIRQASDTPALSIVNNGDGSVTVTFEGTLQAANSVNGPWADVEGAVSPQIIPASEAMQYGRAVK